MGVSRVNEDQVSFQTYLSNDNAAIDPGPTNDSTEGYEPGSRWRNVVTKEAYECIDASVGAAVWELSTFTIDEITMSAIARNVRTITFADHPYTIQDDEDFLRVNATDGDIDIFLQPAATSVPKTVHIKKVSTIKKLDIYPTSGEEIEFQGVNNFYRLATLGSVVTLVAVAAKPGWEIE